MKRNLKILLVVLAMVAVAAVVYALAAANTVPQSYAGAGAGTISGYTVSNVKYNLNATTPSTLDSVEFDLDQTATSASIKLVQAGTTWYSCTNAVNHWTCLTGDHPSISTLDELTVVAAQ